MRTATLVREHVGLDLLPRLRPYGPLARPRCVREREWVVALDAHLDAVAHVAVPGEEEQRLLWASPDLGTVLTSAARGTEVHRPHGLSRLPVRWADSATQLQDGRLLVTARSGGRATAHLLDLDGDRVAPPIALPLPPDEVLAHPTDGSVLLGSGGLVHRLQLYPQAQVEPMLEEAVPAGFLPAGDHLLLLPATEEDDEAVLVSWPDLAGVAGVTAADAGLRDDALGGRGCVLDDRTVLLLTRGGRVVLTDEVLGQAQVLPVGEDVQDLCALWPGVMATQHGTTTRVWRLSEPT